MTFIGDARRKRARAGVRASSPNDGLPTGDGGIANSVEQRFAVLEQVGQRLSDVIVVIDRTGNVVYANPVALSLFGISLEASVGTRAFKYLHPDDVRRVARRFFTLVRIPGASMSDEVTVVTEEGEIRYLEIVTTNCLDNPDVAGIVVNGRDVSERRAYVAELEAREKWHRTLAENSNEITLVLSATGTTLWASPSNVNISGYLAEERIGRSAFDAIHPEDFEACLDHFAEACHRPGTSPPFAVRFATASGDMRFIEVVLTNCIDDPTIGGVVVNAVDVTNTMNLTRALQTLTQGNQVLVRATDEEALLSEICETIVASGGYRLAWVGLKVDDEEQTVRPVMSAGETSYLNEVRFSWGENEFGTGTTGKAIRTGTKQVLRDIRLADDHAAWMEPAIRRGLLTGTSFPLIVDDDVIGALTIYAGEAGAFGPEEVDLLSELASELAYGIGRLRDAQRLSKNDELLRESEQRFRLAFEQNMAPMLFVDLDDQVIAANDAFCRMIGFSREELIGRDSTPFTHPDDVGITEESHRRAVQHELSQDRYIKRYQRKDGRTVIVEVLRSPARDATGKTLYYVISERDVTEEHALTAQLSHQALHDPLTGLANRALFEDRLARAYSRVTRHHSLGAVLLLDLDDFKGVNDVHGHLIGDQLLVAVARRIEQALRSADTIGRFGGDEFLYLAEGLSSPEDAVEVAERLLGALVEPFFIGGVQIEQHASIGVVVWDSASKDPAEIIRDADVALYEAKTNGKGHYVIFTPSMHQQAISRFSLVQELHQALQNGELALHYQPIVDLASSEIVGFEALMRWWHAERGWVPPDVFIPLAEQSGLIWELGSFALHEAMAAASSWGPVGTSGHRPYVSVNLSAQQFHEPRLVGVIEEVLMVYDVAPERLVIEITEGVMLRDATEATNVISRLQDLGVGFALDDFGTGYSSLSYLASMHPRVIKIDQSFVRPTHEGARNDALLETIVSLGGRLSITMLAEGIETSVQLERLRSLGCELGQGYLFSPALPREQLEALMSRRPGEWVPLFDDWTKAAQS
jgi:diguanylate cyclase (GGDEF)-like protein/PAS domain S-box-containing protein